MPLNLYPNIYASGSVPTGWAPSRKAPNKDSVKNTVLLQDLRKLLSGSWQKVYKKGNTGDIHYFEHVSGQVAGVKFYPRGPTP